MGEVKSLLLWKSDEQEKKISRGEVQGESNRERERELEEKRGKRGGRCWDLRLDKLSKFSTKTMIAVEGVESKHST